MALKNWFDTPPNGHVKLNTGPVRVGWLLSEPRSGVVYFPPERMRSVDMNKDHAKSASRCPAIINMESRYFVVRVPFDMHLRLAKDKTGKTVLRNMMGEKSPVRGSVLNKILHVAGEKEWRYPDRPTVQISLPYMFIADEPVYMTQLSTFMHFTKNQMPGTIFGGRFNIHSWPRPLMWAFEWHDAKQDLILKRGEPWFYVSFETMPQERPVSLTETKMTQPLKEYMDHTAAAVNYVNQSFSLFKLAEKVRPEALIEPVKR